MAAAFFVGGSRFFVFRQSGAAFGIGATAFFRFGATVGFGFHGAKLLFGRLGRHPQKRRLIVGYTGITGRFFCFGRDAGDFDGALRAGSVDTQFADGGVDPLVRPPSIVRFV